MSHSLALNLKLLVPAGRERQTYCEPPYLQKITLFWGAKHGGHVSTQAVYTDLHA